MDTRLPKPRERCPITNLSRTSLVEILDEINPATQEPYVRQMRKERHGRQRLIHRQSFLDYLEQCSERQLRRFAPHVSNPNGYTVEEVINDQELFHQFLGPDNPLTDADWNDGKLSTKTARITDMVERVVNLADKVRPVRVRAHARDGFDDLRAS